MNSLPDKIRALTRENGDCWEWIGVKTRDGYGKVTRRPRTWMVHRYVYETLVGPIPAGLTIDHLCRNRACINPAHLEPVTRKVNSERGSEAQRTHCPQGHPYDEANTYRSPRGRFCRACGREHVKKYLRAKRQRAWETVVSALVLRSFAEVTP